MAIVFGLVVVTLLIAAGSARALSVTVGGEDGLVNVDLGSGTQQQQQTAPSQGSGGGESQAPATQAPASTPPASSSPSSGGSSNSGSSTKSSSSSATQRSSGSNTNASTGGDSKSSESGASANRQATVKRRAAAKRRAASKPESSGESKQAAPIAGADTTVLTQSIESQSTPWWLIALAGVLALLAIAAAILLWRARKRDLQVPVTIVSTDDPVTGMAGGIAFDRRLDEEITRSRRFGEPLGLMLMRPADLVPDSGSGSVYEDSVLREIANATRLVVRSTDIVAHPGAGRFAVICPHSDIDLLVDLRSTIEHAFANDESFTWDMDIGVAELEQFDGTAQDLVTRADDALEARHRARMLRLIS